MKFEEGLKPHEVIHIGDSLSSDVSGAQRLGIDAIWLNRLGKPVPDHIHPDYICRNLRVASERLVVSV
ncbi:hypothetical protein JCM10914A_21170 [Paenibacillus sp. JCM 10914]|uniref:HAD family hydrolase n=1 Tax=Paenibacillus sp. JCM 10914 TaxID=1236974 RepID=UPI0003CC3242|nr:HAD hydrolase-like protein [Paenibacillus sp. JCM 10914]GAE08655.1 hypothetical protein JCM10914_4971 [Paenibacillus sp. JCM 10914]